MSRRRQSTVEDIIAVTAKFPWWVGLALALLSYFLLHPLAISTVPEAKDLTQFGSSASKTVIKGLAQVFQYVLPTLFAIGSIASVFARRKRASLPERVATQNSALAEMSWQDFELLVGEYFRRRGFSVKETGGGGPDGGVDLILSTANDKYLVQCKRWKAMQVDVRTVRELYGVMTALGAAGAFVVTSGKFTNDARKFAEGREIELIDADYLLKEIGKDHRVKSPKEEGPLAPTQVLCPTCGARMVLRTARSGANAGQSFWGCSTYPKCRAIRPAT